MQMIKELGKRATLLIANHEQYALTAVYEQNSEKRDYFQQYWLGKRNGALLRERNTLSSYGVLPDAENPISDFKTAIENTHHATLLKSAAPYYETDRFIAVHAGIDPYLEWDEQANYLKWVVENNHAIGDYTTAQPAQWYSIEYAADCRPILSTNKTVVSGHAHQLTGKFRYAYPIRTSPERVLHDGKRVRLASQINIDTEEPLYVWQDWDRQVIAIHRDD